MVTVVRLTRGFVMGALVVLLASAAPAQAQSVGIGGRLATVSGTESPILTGSGESKARFTGGVVRVRFGRLALEGALDYKELKDEAGTASIKMYPLQGSVLYHLSAGRSGLYALAGIGYYTQSLNLILSGDETFRTAAHSVGYHAGAGMELALGRKASAFTDYRYTFVDPPSFSELGGAVIGAALAPVFSPGSDNEGVNTRGSMWTVGLLFIF
ncbi:MAG: outer membrane beta-barrel protein [Vicinamibacterales bacterium]|nr:outer membrane beta-barrel protein [Vicinamibacterales bacterium]